MWALIVRGHSKAEQPRVGAVDASALLLRSPRFKVADGERVCAFGVDQNLFPSHALGRGNNAVRSQGKWSGGGGGKSVSSAAFFVRLMVDQLS